MSAPSEPKMEAVEEPLGRTGSAGVDDVGGEGATTVVAGSEEEVAGGKP